MAQGHNNQVSQSNVFSSGMSSTMLKSTEHLMHGEKRVLLQNSRRNSNIESMVTKVTPNDLKTIQANISYLNPLNNLSDIEHVLSDSRLDAHLHKNMMSGQKENTSSNGKFVLPSNDESMLKGVRTERTYQRLIKRNKNHLFQGVASVNTLPVEGQLVSTSKTNGVGLTSFSGGATHKRAQSSHNQVRPETATAATKIPSQNTPAESSQFAPRNASTKVVKFSEVSENQ